MENETVLVDGMFFQKPHEKTPDFVKGHVGIKADELITFLQTHKKKDGWVNIDLLKSKKGKLYFKLNTWTPPEKTENPVESPAVPPEAPPITDDDVPF